MNNCFIFLQLQGSIPPADTPQPAQNATAPNMANDPTSITNQLVIWGTDIVVSHCKEKFTMFVST